MRQAIYPYYRQSAFGIDWTERIAHHEYYHAGGRRGHQ